MVGIFSDIIQIVVLATSTNALLAVGISVFFLNGQSSAGHQFMTIPLQLSKRARRIYGSQEKGLELVHTRIGEQQRWVLNKSVRRHENEEAIIIIYVMRNDWRRGDVGVTLLLAEEIHESITNFINCPHDVILHLQGKL